MPNPPDLREAAVWVVENELGKPYIWGGNDPVAGWDCSGLMIEALKATGKLSRRGDWRASQLATMFPASTTLKRGMLVFWNRGSSIGHVEMVWSVIEGQVFTIGASGGGSATVSREAAIEQDAYVRIRPIDPGWVRAVDPF